MGNLQSKEGQKPNQPRWPFSFLVVVSNAFQLFGVAVSKVMPPKRAKDEIYDAHQNGEVENIKYIHGCQLGIPTQLYKSKGATC